MARLTPLPSRFLRMQAIHDLRASAELFADGARGGALGRIAALTPGVRRDDLARAVRRGALPEGAPAPREALELAAALPERDPEAFRLSTALLLIDAIGGGGSDLTWHFDAHADAYRAAPPPVRAALMNGFRLLDALGLAALDPPPGAADRASLGRATVEDGLASAPLHLRAPLLAALAGGPTEPTEALWRERGRDLVVAPPVADAMRHLYETRDEWDPYRDWSEARIAREGVAIPFEAS